MRTRATPRLYYLPAEHNETSKALLKLQREQRLMTLEREKQSLLEGERNVVDDDKDNNSNTNNNNNNNNDNDDGDNDIDSRSNNNNNNNDNNENENSDNNTDNSDGDCHASSLQRCSQDHHTIHAIGCRSYTQMYYNIIIITAIGSLCKKYY